MQTHCEICGTEVVPSPKQRGGGNKKYCSPKCRRKSRAMAESSWRKEDTKNNPDKWRKMGRVQKLKSTYGMTLEDYDALVKKQEGLCPICQKPLPTIEEENGKHPPVDHNHVTGKPCGVLHNKCNRALGFLQDSSELCRKAAEYLERHGR
jgi:endogenous inhibitor of DNA gyrase (YacG/DUF329 family)